MYRVQEVVAGKHVIRGYYRTIYGAAEAARRITGKNLDPRAAERLKAGYKLPIEVTGPTGDVQAVIVPLDADAKRVYTLHGRETFGSELITHHPLIEEAFTPADIALAASRRGWRSPSQAEIAAELVVRATRAIPLRDKDGKRTGFIRAWEVE